MSHSDVCGVRKIKSIGDERGRLCVVQAGEDLPFEIKRVFSIFDVPVGAVRGGHAHIDVWEAIIAVKGAFTFETDDGEIKRSFRLDSPDMMLVLPPLHWLRMSDFGADTVVVVLASGPHDDADYLRSYDDFLDFFRSR